jgi:phosphatidyl-myo-inositol dimannoside synthase
VNTVNGTPRTLLITDRYFPEVGGSVVWFDNVYRRHPPRTVWIVTQSYPNAAAVDATFPDIHTVRMALKRYRFLRPESLVLIAKLVAASAWTVQRHSIEIVHAGKVLPEGLAAGIVSRLTGVPYVVYTHGEELTVTAADPAYRHHFGRLRAVYDGAAAVIANSDFTRDELIRFGVGRDRIVRISPGVDPSIFRPVPKDPDLVRRYGLDGKTVLLSVGRLQRRKGHDFVLQALPEVLAAYPDLVYVIVSDGEERTYLESLARELRIDDSVRFVGEVGFDALPRWYNTCDVFVMANRRMANGDVEGFGIAFLEAGACAKPVIAGESGGTADAVKHGETGLRIDASDPKNIRDVILKLVGDPVLARRLGENARRNVEMEHGWDTVAERIRTLSANLSCGRC